MQDQFGIPLTGGDSAAIASYDQGVSQLLTLSGDPVASARAVAESAPGFIMAHVLYGVLHALSTERAALREAQSGLDAARDCEGDASPRERAHVAALHAFTDGRLKDAVAIWEQVLIDEPRDALAMFAAHQTDFFLGQSTELRDRVARRLRSIERGSTLEGHYLGMYSFGLEECGEYARAEKAGRRAVESCAKDAWAIHAVAHVMEMENRVDEGIDWLQERAQDWSTDSFFAIHNWWHLALYHVDREDWPSALALFDDHISRVVSALDMIDGSALLWRLGLYGVDVGDRWNGIAAAWEPLVDDAFYAFNDLHAMMAFLGAGRRDFVEHALAVMAVTAKGSGDNARNVREFALPTAQALCALVDGDPARCIDLLEPARALAIRAGGSHAQRDLLSQTLLAAALRAGRHRLARALVDERLAARPDSRLNLNWDRRLAG
jgi:hypothetical protein